MSNRCGMGCDAPAERGGFYCHGCLSKWDRQREKSRQIEKEEEQGNEIAKLKEEIIRLKIAVKELTND